MLKRTSPFRAKLNYWYQVFHYLRPFAIRTAKLHYLNQHDMIRNYFKIGWRNLLKQRMYSSIKIGGFAIGIAACLLIALFILDELRYDKQYPDRGRIYQVIGCFKDNGEVKKGVCFPAPMARALQEDFPEVEKAGRYNDVVLFGALRGSIRRSANS